MILAIFDRLKIVFCNFFNHEILFVQYVLRGQKDNRKPTHHKMLAFLK